MANPDEAWMRRAIELAATHHGLTADNPSVGCVLVKDGMMLSEAVTATGGRPHAEEQALAMAGPAARGATAYVTLEPCGGRSSDTASCAERLVTAGIARVVVAARDPSPLASGRGLQRLLAAGIAPEIGLLADEAAFLAPARRDSARP